jgi:hypothetical protein
MTDAGTCAKDSKGVTLTCAQFNGCIPHATPTLYSTHECRIYDQL